MSFLRQIMSFLEAGTRERYKGTEHGLDNLVEKSKLEIVCFRCCLLIKCSFWWTSACMCGARLVRQSSCLMPTVIKSCQYIDCSCLHAFL